MHFFNYELLFFLVLPFCRPADVHHCVHYVRKVSKGNDGTVGDGSTPNSCLACDPTLPQCPEGCEGMLKNMFNYCSGICLPDGYFFDESKNHIGKCIVQYDMYNFDIF